MKFSSQLFNIYFQSHYLRQSSFIKMTYSGHWFHKFDVYKMKIYLLVSVLNLQEINCNFSSFFKLKHLKREKVNIEISLFILSFHVMLLFTLISSDFRLSLLKPISKLLMSIICKKVARHVALFHLFLYLLLHWNLFLFQGKMKN